jgi:hypothetical protein
MNFHNPSLISLLWIPANSNRKSRIARIRKTHFDVLNALTCGRSINRMSPPFLILMIEIIARFIKNIDDHFKKYFQ